MSRLPHFYTRKNHFEFGFDQKLFLARPHPEAKLFANYGRCEREPLDFRSELLIAAREIAQTYGDRIYLALSGGIDSEIMVEAFRFARRPFKILITRFENDLNIHDIRWAINYCDKNKLDYEFYDLKVIEFLQSPESSRWMEETGCVYPMLTVQMKIMQHISQTLGGVPVLGSGEILLAERGRRWCIVDSEQILTNYLFMIQQAMPGVPGFFQWSPEILYAALVDPTLQRLMRETGLPQPFDFGPFKLQMYNNYFSVEARPKYYGFEKFVDFIKPLQEAREKKAPYRLSACANEVGPMLSNLRPLKT